MGWENCILVIFFKLLYIYKLPHSRPSNSNQYVILSYSNSKSIEFRVILFFPYSHLSHGLLSRHWFEVTKLPLQEYIIIAAVLQLSSMQAFVTSCLPLFSQYSFAPSIPIPWPSYSCKLSPAYGFICRRNKLCVIFPFLHKACLSWLKLCDASCSRCPISCPDYLLMMFRMESLYQPLRFLCATVERWGCVTEFQLHIYSSRM